MDSMKLEDCCEILDSQRVPITGSDRTSGDYPYYGANGIQDYVDDFIFDVTTLHYSDLPSRIASLYLFANVPVFFVPAQLASLYQSLL